MKRILSFLLVAVMLLSLLPASVLAAPADYEYTVDGGAATVTAYNGPGGAVVVDATLGGAPVTAVTYSVFSGNSALTDITLPATVTAVAEQGFLNCANLKSFSVAENSVMTSVGSNAFTACKSLTDVTLPDMLTDIGSSAFSGCTALERIELPDAVSDLGSLTFQNCTALKSVKLPDSIDTIVYGMFKGCTSLTDVVLPADVTAIDSTAFMNCSALQYLTVGEQVTSIAPGAFSGCTSLTLRVKKDSAAHVYAVTYNIPYITRDCATEGHVTSSVVLREPTYYQEGSQQVTCEYCDYDEILPIPRKDITKVYADVTPSHWFYDASSFCLDRGLITGSGKAGDGSGRELFKPDAQTTRAQVVMILWRYVGSPEPTGNVSAKFTDVVQSAWYIKAVEWAAENGVVGGVTASTFAPDRPISRRDFAVIMYRFTANILRKDVSDRADLSAFEDYNTLPTYATDAMSWANAVSLIGGIGKKLEHGGFATRAQIATILMRFCTQFED